MKRNCVRSLVCLVMLTFTGSALGAVTYWDFSSGDLSAASGTSIMEYRDGEGGATSTGTYFMTTDGSYVPHINGQAASYMYWPATKNTDNPVYYDQGFNVTQYSGNNLTSYTVAMDVLIPDVIFNAAANSGQYTGLFNTSTLNNNDADWYLYRPLNSETNQREGSMFVDRDDTNSKVWCDTNIMQADTWYRLVMTYNEDDPESDVRVYLNGTQVGASDAMFGTPALRLPTTIPFFTDNNADVSDGCVASLAVCDFSMSAAEVTALGGPTAAGLNNIVDHPWTPEVPPVGTSNYATAVTASNPLVYLRLNEDAGTPDLSPAANSGTSTITTASLGLPGNYPLRNPETGAAGVNGLDTIAGREITGFEGDNKSYVFAPATSNFPSMIQLTSSYDNGGTTAYEMDLAQVSYAFWIKTGAPVEGVEYLLTTPDYGGVNFSNDFHISIDNTNGRISLATQAVNLPLTSNYAATTDLDLSSLYDNEWHFLVATRDGNDASNVTLYIDGEAINLAAISANVGIGYTHRIGTLGSSSARFSGELDEIAIWDRVLSVADVTALLNAAATPNVQPKIPGDANGDKKVDGSDVTILAGNWQMLQNATWEMGDFNGDGKVDGSDVTILAGNWQYGASAAAASVPEPSTLVLLIVAVGSLLLWRRR